jgi:peptidoglycan biosynthesis protein MviN/MurJ (putative lipid II flippase)
MATAASQTSETSALLAHNGLPVEEQVQNGDYGTNVEEASKKDPDLQTDWRIESKLLARYSTPLFFTYLLQYSFQTTTVVIAGRLGTNELGAVSLATMTANVTGLAIYEGLATSLDTLCSQAHGGGKKKLVGLHMQRVVYLLLLVTIPIGAIWICSPWILEALVPEKELAQLAGVYLRIYLIGMPGYATFEAGKRLVQAQGDFTGSLAVLSICAPLNIFLNWLFVFVSSITLSPRPSRRNFTSYPVALTHPSSISAGALLARRSQSLYRTTCNRCSSLHTSASSPLPTSNAGQV